MSAPREMDCPECAASVSAMQGSTWAIAWYSCGRCGTFWYTRLRVGPETGDSLGLTGADVQAGPIADSVLSVGADLQVGPMATARQHRPRASWSIEQLEAEADSLRREGDLLPKGNREALRLHLEKLKVLADAINQRLDSHTARVTPRPS